MRLGYSLPEIEQYFKEIFNNTAREKVGSYHVPIDDKMELRDVFHVPLELPRYRLDNTRTLHLQKKYITSNGLNENFFEEDIWLDKLQEIQHEILKSLIDRKGLKVFFEKNIQTDPLILTHDGFVISGNRRLCAYRELYYSNEGVTKYKKFERIRVVILPKCSDEQIEYIEDFLEQQPDLKDEFTWISRAIGFRKRIEKHNYNTQILAQKSNGSFKKVEIDSLLQQLNIAENYLEFIGRESDYDIIENDKFAFDQIEKCRRNLKSNGSKKDLFQKLSFVALKNQDKITDRMYRNIPFIMENLNEIEDEIRLEYEDDIQEIEKEIRTENPLNDITLFPDNTLSTLALLDIKANDENVFSIIHDKVTEAKSLKEEKNRKQAVLKKIKKAYAILVEANNIRSSESNKSGIYSQLTNIEKIIKELKEWATT